ncbi:hypothetical protein GCM10010401_09000 [Rarobacter faecitabidus]|uniref:histidine kinase n=1 Tax=Rarobacter faecitabidus TaxID=13243 RepID=A0A542ZB72_RARFA|nr:ATP-binding protein [Rarobacter faecitabidus]TQL57500.1 signal transduction histidine kinase [Rarobacter faecitabidus]
MLRRLSVRGKILATLAVPIIVLIAAAALIAVQSVTAALDGRQYELLARTTPAHDELMAALQNEYTVTLQRASGVKVSDADFNGARATTDGLRTQYLSETSAVNFDRFPVAVRAAWQRSKTGLEGLDRALVDEFLAAAEESNPTPTVVATYSRAIESQEEFYQTVTDSISDRNVAGYLALYANAFDLRSAYLTELRQTTPVIQQRESITADDPAVRNATLSIQDYQVVESRTQSSLTNLGITDFALPEMASDQVAARDRIRAGNPEALTSQQANVWGSATADFDTKLAQFQVQVRDKLIAEVGNMANTARTQAILTVAIAIAAVIISLAIALLIARRIVNPLSRLTEAAKDVRDKLPTLVEQVAVPGTTPDLVIEPIPVESGDEIGQLATAFNDVNETTVEVAQEQAALRGSIAEMFVNVARRDHALLNRQLSFLDELERTEEDPTVLSNLFRLDHLATRMRRNSESLLVLAGIDSGRRVRQSMALSDVVRTASSEIEAYDRISLTLLDDPDMLGHYALYAAHLMAELLENATMFSDPSQQVEVTTNADRHYVSVAIRDFGLGMTEDEIGEARLKVQSRSASDAVGAQRLGLFVVGRLAEKLDASVDFQNAPGGGTLVVIAFPRSLFAELTDSELDDQAVAPVAPVRRTADEIATSDEGVPPSPVEEVDLAALTDGTTATGMPRRRTDGADSASASELDEDLIVLPELAQPNVEGLPQAGSADDEAWQPLQAVTPETGGGLPSRGGGGLPVRSASSAVAPEAVEPEAEAVPVDTERRSAIFSRFRTTEDLAAATTDDSTERSESSALDEPSVADLGSGDEAGLDSAADAADDVVQRSSMFASFRPSGEPETAAEPEPWTPPQVELPESGEDTWTPPSFGAQDELPATPAVDDAWTPPVFGDVDATPDAVGETESWTPPSFGGQDELPATPAVDDAWTPPVFGDDADGTVGEATQEPLGESVADQSEWTAPGYTDAATTDSWVNAGAEAAPLAQTGDEAVDGDTRLVLPRHAAPDDLERMMREYGGPEGVSAALTGPLPVVDESLIEDPTYLDGLASGDEVAEQAPEELAPEEPTLDEAATVQEAESDEVWQPGAAQDSFQDIPQLQLEEDDDFLSDDTIMVARPGLPEFGTTDSTHEPQASLASDYAADSEIGFGATEPVFAAPADDVAADEAEPWVATESAPAESAYASVDASAPAESAYAPVEASAPAESAYAPAESFTVSEDTTPAPAKKKKGLFSRVFGGKKKTPEVSQHEPFVPAAAPVAESLAAPTGPTSWVAPATTQTAPAFPETFAPTPEEASSEAVESGVAHGAAAAPDDSAGYGQASFTPAPGNEPQGWSPNAVDFSASDTPRSMSPELAAMLASRADLQDQALAELSQLSTYRPQQVTPDAAGGLVKRQKTEPVTEPVADDPTKQRITRDASVLRTRLAAFQSGTSRGREVGVKVSDSDPSSEGDSHDAS